MTRISLSTIALGFGLLSACDGGNPDCADCTSSGSDLDSGSGDCTADCPDDDTGDPDATATFVGPSVSFTDADGLVTEESCTTNLQLGQLGAVQYQVITDEEKKVEPRTYTATFGDTALVSEASGYLPVHTLASGWQAVAPFIDVPVQDGQTVELPAPALALYVQGTWTCEFDNGFSDHGEVAYQQIGDDVQVCLNGIGCWNITGMLVEYPENEENIVGEGEFLTNTWLEISSIGGLDDYDADCWKGLEADKPF